MIPGRFGPSSDWELIEGLKSDGSLQGRKVFHGKGIFSRPGPLSLRGISLGGRQIPFKRTVRLIALVLLLFYSIHQVFSNVVLMVLDAVGAELRPGDLKNLRSFTSGKLTEK